jgi:hypothetical protein
MFRPYALEIGKLSLEWNALQEVLALLFAAAIDDGHGTLLAYKVWHSTPNDRAQREMLRAATGVKFSKEPYMPYAPAPTRALDDVEWLLKEVDRLADRRNDAIHSPFWQAFYGDEVRIEPATSLGHPRARKLAGKDVLAEFKWYQECARVLRVFAFKLCEVLMWFPQRPWPDRPQLPHLGQSKTRNTKLPRKTTR